MELTMDATDRIIQISENLATVKAELAEHNRAAIARLKSIEQKLDGNGRPGLVDRLQAVEASAEKARDHGKRLASLEETIKKVTWSGVSFVAVLTLIFGGLPTWVYNGLRKLFGGQ